MDNLRGRKNSDVITIKKIDLSIETDRICLLRFSFFPIIPAIHPKPISQNLVSNEK